MKKHVGQDLEMIGQMFPVAHYQVSGVVITGETVDVASQIFNLLLDLVSGSLLRSRKDEMFKKM